MRCRARAAAASAARAPCCRTRLCRRKISQLWARRTSFMRSHRCTIPSSGPAWSATASTSTRAASSCWAAGMLSSWRGKPWSPRPRGKGSPSEEIRSETGRWSERMPGAGRMVEEAEKAWRKDSEASHRSRRPPELAGALQWVWARDAPLAARHTSTSPWSAMSSVRAGAPARRVLWAGPGWPGGYTQSSSERTQLRSPVSSSGRPSPGRWDRSVVEKKCWRSPGCAGP